MYLKGNNPTYQTRAGETLYSVAKKHGLTLAELTKLNPDMDKGPVKPGTRLKLPPSAAAPSHPEPIHSAPAHPAPATQQSPSALRDDMRALWTQHVWWTRELIISILARLPDQQPVTNRLLQNPAQIAALFSPAFGDAAAQTVSQLLTEHLAIGAELITATKDGDIAALDDANQRWYGNANAIAKALAGLGPQFSEAGMRQMLQDHLDLTKREVAARARGDYASDIRTFDEIERQALMMADQLSAGISYQ